MKVSNCCGVEAYSNGDASTEDYGICPECKEHCEYESVKEISDFKLTGLSKPQSFTCEPLNNENIFWAKNGLGEEKFNELWNYCKGNWTDKKIAEIEHEGLNNDGTPINPIVVGIIEC